MKILVTGAAGFIGMHVAIRLLERGDEVVGVDNINDYYDIKLKYDRLEQIKHFSKFRFLKHDISDTPAMETLFSQEKFQSVVNLAAQPGVRYSLQNPHAYISSNIVDLPIFWKVAVTTTWDIWSMQAVQASMAPIPICHFLCIRTLTIRSAFMQRQRRHAN